MAKQSLLVLSLIFVSFVEIVLCRLTVKPKDAESKVGGSIRLNCSTDVTSREIQWFYYPIGRSTDRVFVFAWGQMHHPYLDRFRVDRGQQSSTTETSYDLVIVNVTSDDAGSYQCWDDGGHAQTGQYSAADVIVLESDPVCSSSVPLDDVIGENSCGVPPDDLELRCEVKFRGNHSPVLQLRSAGGAEEKEGQRNSTGGRATSRLTMKGTRSLSGSSFVCQTKASTEEEQQQQQQPPHSCTSAPTIRVAYAFENRTEAMVRLGEEVSCVADVGSGQLCSYRWFNDRDEQVSDGPNLTTNRLGSHECRALCDLSRRRGQSHRCQVVARRIYVTDFASTTLSSPSNAPPTFDDGSDRTLLFLLFLLILIAVIVVPTVLLVLHIRRKHMKTVAEMQALIYNDRPEKVVYSDDPVPVHTIPQIAGTGSDVTEDRKLRGVAVLNQFVFVVRSKCPEVVVFDSNGAFAECRRFQLVGLIDPWDMVSCQKNTCLYVMDGKQRTREEEDKGAAREILRVEPSGEVVCDWSTKRDAGYLSVTKEGNILLAVYKKNQLKEFTPNGELVKKIRVSPTRGRVIHPHHAVKLATGHFLVIHGIGDSLHRACIVDDQGTVIKAFGGRKGSTESTMNLPKYLAVDRAGSVMVLDQNNNRVLLLNFDLQFQKQLVTREKFDVVNPCRIYLDESGGRLFVAQDDCIRVFSVIQAEHGAAAAAARVWDDIV